MLSRMREALFESPLFSGTSSENLRTFPFALPKDPS